MPIQEPIEPSIHSRFETEKLSRTITNCTDLRTVKGIAMELLALHQKKAAIASWATKRAIEAEERAMKAERALRENIND